MTTLTEQTGAVIDYLVAQCRASPSLGAASPPVLVFDGPLISDTALTELQRMWIGSQGYTAPGTEVEAAVFSEAFAYLDHARTRDDQIDINCAAEYVSADPTQVKAARDGAFALMATVELMLRGDPNAGGPGDASMGGLVYWSQISGPCQLVQAQLATGVSALVRFRVSAFTRLTT